MHVVVVEPDAGIRCVLCVFLKEEGYLTAGYIDMPAGYHDVDVMIFGPTFSFEERQRSVLDDMHIPYLQLDYFEDMEDVLKRVAGFAHIEQSILEDRAV